MSDCRKKETKKEKYIIKNEKIAEKHENPKLAKKKDSCRLNNTGKSKTQPKQKGHQGISAATEQLRATKIRSIYSERRFQTLNKSICMQWIRNFL